MPPRKNSEAPEIAPIRAWSLPHVRLSATASVQPRRLEHKGLQVAHRAVRLADPLQVREPRLEVGARRACP